MGETGTGQVLQKNEHKALLFVAQENTRGYAIIMLFLQVGLLQQLGVVPSMG
jgi:hypothetical protein